jgi:hypothetical protein
MWLAAWAWMVLAAASTGQVTTTTSPEEVGSVGLGSPLPMMQGVGVVLAVRLSMAEAEPGTLVVLRLRPQVDLGSFSANNLQVLDSENRPVHFASAHRGAGGWYIWLEIPTSKPVLVTMTMEALEPLSPLVWAERVLTCQSPASLASNNRATGGGLMAMQAGGVLHNISCGNGSCSGCSDGPLGRVASLDGQQQYAIVEPVEDRAPRAVMIVFLPQGGAGSLLYWPGCLDLSMERGVLTVNGNATNASLASGVWHTLMVSQAAEDRTWTVLVNATVVSVGVRACSTWPVALSIGGGPGRLNMTGSIGEVRVFPADLFSDSLAQVQAAEITRAVSYVPDPAGSSFPFVPFCQQEESAGMTWPRTPAGQTARAAGDYCPGDEQGYITRSCSVTRWMPVESHCTASAKSGLDMSSIIGLMSMVILLLSMLLMLLFLLQTVLRLVQAVSTCDYIALASGLGVLALPIIQLLALTQGAELGTAGCQGISIALAGAVFFILACNLSVFIYMHAGPETEARHLRIPAAAAVILPVLWAAGGQSIFSSQLTSGSDGSGTSIVCWLKPSATAFIYFIVLVLALLVATAAMHFTLPWKLRKRPSSFYSCWATFFLLIVVMTMSLTTLQTSPWILISSVASLLHSISLHFLFSLLRTIDDVSHLSVDVSKNSASFLSASRMSSWFPPAKSRQFKVSIDGLGSDVSGESSPPPKAAMPAPDGSSEQRQQQVTFELEVPVPKRRKASMASSHHSASSMRGPLRPILRQPRLASSSKMIDDAQQDEGPRARVNTANSGASFETFKV